MFAVQGVLPQASLLLPMEGSNRAANHAACGMGRDNDFVRSNDNHDGRC
jgi:hypothetical protein